MYISCAKYNESQTWHLSSPTCCYLMYLSSLGCILLPLKEKAKYLCCQWCVPDRNLMGHLTWKNVVTFQIPLILLFLKLYIGRIFIITKTFLTRFLKEKSIFSSLFCVSFSTFLIFFWSFDQSSHFREELRSQACLSSYKSGYILSLNRRDLHYWEKG